MEVGLIAFTMGVKVLEDKLADSTCPDIRVPLMISVPILLTCLGVLIDGETAVFADWVTRGCELEEAVLVVTAFPTGIPFEIIVAAREVSSFIGSERCLSEGFTFGKMERLNGVTVTDELLLEEVLTTAVGLRRISGVRVFNGPPTWFIKVPADFLIVAGGTGEELALVTAADGTFLLVFDALDFSGLLAFACLPLYPLMSDDFPFTSGGGGGEERFGPLSFVKCVFFSLLLLLCLFCPLSLCLSPS